MGTSPGFAAWFDRVSLSNAARQDNRCLSMAVGAGPFEPPDVHGTGLRSGDGQAAEGAVDHLVVRVRGDGARAQVAKPAAFHGEPVEVARYRGGQVAIYSFSIEQHVQVVAEKVADYVVFQAQALDFLGEHDFYVAVFPDDQFGTFFTLERFMKAGPRGAVGADTQAGGCMQRLFVPQKLPFDVLECSSKIMRVPSWWGFWLS